MLCASGHETFSKLRGFDTLVLKLKSSVKEGLEDYYGEKELRKTCKVCKKKRSVTLRRQHLTFPELLCIKIDRVNGDNTFSDKPIDINKRIMLRQRGLEIEYKLFGFVHVKGSVLAEIKSVAVLSSLEKPQYFAERVKDRITEELPTIEGYAAYILFYMPTSPINEVVIAENARLAQEYRAGERFAYVGSLGDDDDRVPVEGLEDEAGAQPAVELQAAQNGSESGAGQVTPLNDLEAPNQEVPEKPQEPSDNEEEAIQDLCGLLLDQSPQQLENTAYNLEQILQLNTDCQDKPAYENSDLGRKALARVNGYTQKLGETIDGEYKDHFVQSLATVGLETSGRQKQVQMQILESLEENKDKVMDKNLDLELNIKEKQNESEEELVDVKGSLASQLMGKYQPFIQEAGQWISDKFDIFNQKSHYRSNKDENVGVGAGSI